MIFPSRTGALAELAAALKAGEVKTLVILRRQSGLQRARRSELAAAQRRAQTVVRLGYYEDETAALCDWHFPAAHYLESWGDARTGDGTVFRFNRSSHRCLMD